MCSTYALVSRARISCDTMCYEDWVCIPATVVGMVVTRSPVVPRRTESTGKRQSLKHPSATITPGRLHLCASDQNGVLAHLGSNGPRSHCVARLVVGHSSAYLILRTTGRPLFRTQKVCRRVGAHRRCGSWATSPWYGMEGGTAAASLPRLVPPAMGLGLGLRPTEVRTVPNEGKAGKVGEVSQDRLSSSLPRRVSPFSMAGRFCPHRFGTEVDRKDRENANILPHGKKRNNKIYIKKKINIRCRPKPRKKARLAVAHTRAHTHMHTHAENPRIHPNLFRPVTVQSLLQPVQLADPSNGRPLAPAGSNANSSGPSPARFWDAQ
ncbi:hypothetical protein VTK73DRAFT_3378 [Phialemonium thermophilum]|uniref:Uncharacterized protein n=1 Tax=Phialemonium thermophilum TaxID=223376 RepID=A0ABR3VJ62_9PEZI